MKTYILFFLALSSLVAEAQKAHITLKLPQKRDFTVSLTTEQVRYHEAPSIGLTDMEFLNIGYFDDSTKQWAMTEFELKEPQVVRLDLISKKIVTGQNPSSNGSRLLFISPNDSLTITVAPDKSLTFSGSHASYQELLRDCFKGKMYEYLPVFGYNPTKIDNTNILPKVDSLQMVRQQRLQSLNNPSPEFESYIKAMTLTEAYLLRLIVSDKKIRESQGVQLKPDERKTIQDFTLQNFKILSDAALMSESYRNELKNFIQIPVIQKYPTDSAKAYVLTPEAVRLAYQNSEEKLGAYPKQRQYLLTHWLDYATTFRSDMSAARDLLERYQSTYPNSELIPYFKRTIETKERMAVGQAAPNFTLKDREGNTLSLSSFQGKPVCIAFCFNLKQHEFIFKPLETFYNDRITFVYLNVTPSTSFELWQSTTEKRPGVVHLWASEEDAQKLKDTYATSMRYPFVLVDAQGKIVERWIPQEFPDNPVLQKEIKALLGRK